MERNNIIKTIIVVAIIFMPAAYLLIGGLLIFNVARGDFNVLKEIKNNKVYLVTLICMILSVAFSELWYISILFAILIFSCLYFAAYTSAEIQKENFTEIMKTIYFASMIVFIFGLIQYLSPTFTIPVKWVDYNNYQISRRVYSTFQNPNIFGFYINVIILISCVDIETKSNSLIAKITASLGLLCLVFTYSRTSWISLCFSLFIIGFFIDKKYLKYLLLASVFIFSLDFISGVGRTSPIKAVNDSGLIYRLEIWKASLKIFIDHPITGIGFGTLFDYIVDYSETISAFVEHSHNIYIQILVDMGIIGLITSLFISNEFLLFVINLLRKNRKDKFAIVSIGLVSMTLVHGLADSVFFTYQIMILAFFYMGVFVKVKKDVKKD